MRCNVCGKDVYFKVGERMSFTTDELTRDQVDELNSIPPDGKVFVRVGVSAVRCPTPCERKDIRE